MKTNTYLIGDMPAGERPRERLERLGSASLSEVELLAILLRVGIKGESAIQLAQRLLAACDGLNGLYKKSFTEISQIKGVGKAKACQIKAALELGARIKKDSVEDRPTVSSANQAAALVQFEMAALPQENLWVLLLDTRNRLISIEKLYQGTLYASNVRNAEIFKAAILKNAASIIIVHNHPSGDPTPSNEDLVFTRSAVEAGKQLELEVYDHLIIAGHENFISMREKGVGFSR